MINITGKAAVFCLCICLSYGEALARQADPADEAPKHIFGIVPNFRTFGSSEENKPITPKEKFKIAAEDSFDRGTVALGALFGGQAMLAKSTPSYGYGVSGSAKYVAASYADFVIGNYMTEAVFPTLFHQDPRYFRRATGGAWSRLGSAAGQIFWTRSDLGHKQFNFSEMAGASAGVAISNAYYSDNRNAADAATRLGVQIGLDIYLPVLFLHFVSVWEILGAVGLILPGLLNIRPGLTPLAAAGLVIIMVGATIVSALTGPLPLALVPFVTGLLAAFIAYSRSGETRHVV